MARPSTVDPNNIIPILQKLNSTSIGPQTNFILTKLQYAEQLYVELGAATSIADANTTLHSIVDILSGDIYSVVDSLSQGAPDELVQPLRKFADADNACGDAVQHLLGVLIAAGDSRAIDAAITGVVDGYEGLYHSLDTSRKEIKDAVDSNAAGIHDMLSVILIILGSTLQYVVGLIGAVGSLLHNVNGTDDAVVINTLNQLTPQLRHAIKAIESFFN